MTLNCCILSDPNVGPGLIFSSQDQKGKSRFYDGFSKKNNWFSNIQKVRKNVVIITPEDPYFNVDKHKYLSSIYPNLPCFTIPFYPGHGGYNRILRTVFSQNFQLLFAKLI